MSTNSQELHFPIFDTEALEKISTAQQDAVKRLMDATGVLFEGMADCSRQWMEFLAGRMQKTFDMQNELYSCSSVTDVVGLQSGYVQTAVDDYSEQSSSMMELGSKIVKDDLKAIVSPAATSKDIPMKDVAPDNPDHEAAA